MPAPANMFLPDSRPAVPLPRFSRHLHTTEDEGGEAGEICVRPALYTQKEEETYLQKAEQLHMLMTAVTDRFAWGDSESTKADVAELKEEVQYLNKVNRELYEFSTQLLTKPT